MMTVKLGRDLRATWSRLVLMVTAIAVSLLVFGAVLYAWSTASRESERAYLATEPASATILLDRPITVDEMTDVAAGARDLPGVIEATGRTQFISDVSVNGQPREIPLQVFVAAPDDPMRMAIVEVRPDGWPPQTGELHLDTDSLSLLGVEVGDTVTVEVPGGETASLQIAAGVAYDPSLAPAPQDQRGHGYVSTASLVTSDDQPALDQLKIQVADEPGDQAGAVGAASEMTAAPSRDRETIVGVASDVGQWLEREHGLTVREIQVPPPAEHPHQGQADALLGSLLAGGGVALLLSAILVANTLNGLFTQQIPQIGIMKATGARSGRIGRYYLTMTLLVAVAATLLALGPAIGIGRAGARAILGFLGIEAVSISAPWWTYVVIIAAGLVLPPLLTVPPLVRASRTTVRAAIDHHGGGSAARSRSSSRMLAWFGSGRLVRRLRLPDLLDRGLLLALRNTVRRPARFVLSVGLLASAGAVFVTGMSLGDGLTAVQDEATEQRNWDVDVRLGGLSSVDEVSALLAEVPGVERVEGWTVAQTGIAGAQQIPLTRTYPDQGHGGVSLAAVPATTTFTPPKLLDGRWLEPGETGAIVLNQIARANTVPDIGIGDTVELSVSGEPTLWEVVGLAQERLGSGGAYVTAEGLALALGQPETMVNQLRVATDRHDEPTRAAVADAIDEALTDAGIEVGSAESVSRQEAVIEGHLGPIIALVLTIAVAMAIVGCIGLASTMSTNVLDRTRELGIMHSIGARPKTIRRIVMAEGVFLALASCVVAIAPALALTAITGAGLGNQFMGAPLPYRVSALAAGIWLVIVVLGSLLATEAAASRASRLTVREALAYL